MSHDPLDLDFQLITVVHLLNESAADYKNHRRKPGDFSTGVQEIESALLRIVNLPFRERITEPCDYLECWSVTGPNDSIKTSKIGFLSARKQRKQVHPILVMLNHASGAGHRPALPVKLSPERLRTLS